MTCLCNKWSFGFGSLIIAGLISTANAGLIHRYSFDGDVSDSVGGADGMVVDPSGNYATFSDGQLDLSANSGQTSNQDFSNSATEGAYVDLPNGTISALGQKATFEMWFTLETNHVWAEVFCFGTSNNGENTSASGSASNYIALIPQNNSDGSWLTHHITTGAQTYIADSVFSTANEHHAVVVYDETDTSIGANGTISLYLDGGLVGAMARLSDFSLSGLDDVNNWLGRSQWNDPLFDGLYNEFRIYDQALTVDQVGDSYDAGPDTVAVPEPSTWLLVAMGLAGLAACRWRKER